MIQTFSEALAAREAQGVILGEAKGVALGEARGVALGEARGKLIATREAIVLLARSLHGTLPTGFAEKLDAISDLPRLYEILEQIPRVSSLDEI